MLSSGYGLPQAETAVNILKDTCRIIMRNAFPLLGSWNPVVELELRGTGDV